MEHDSGTRAVLSIVRTVADTGSTNADLRDLAASGAEDGLWLRAERQSAGRGRLGRDWASPAGNLYASHLVRLRPTDPPAPTLALVAAVALEEAVDIVARSQGRTVAARLKWPNDLLIDGAKVSGILLERAGDSVVIGIGVNLAHHPDLPDRPTTSLAAHGVDVTPTKLLESLAETMGRWIAAWRAEGLAPVRSRWLERAHPIGTALGVNLPDGDAVTGAFDGLDASGALLLRLSDGGRRIVHAADVFLA